MIGATSDNVIAVQDTQPTDTDTKIWLPETAPESIEVPTMDDMNTALATKVGDVQVNGTSVVTDGTANIPTATSTVAGVVKVDSNYGVTMDSTGRIRVTGASAISLKNGLNSNTPVVSSNEHIATFYGLAKAAGDDTQSASDNAVGTYTSEAKDSILSMIGAETVENVSGTTPAITGVKNTRYICGTVTEISITPPASGCIDVLFESGSTPTLLTVPNTVKWPAWFNPVSLDANCTYEINILDGIYGTVMAWA